MGPTTDDGEEWPHKNKIRTKHAIKVTFVVFQSVKSTKVLFDLCTVHMEANQTQLASCPPMLSANMILFP